MPKTRVLLQLEFDLSIVELQARVAVIMAEHGEPMEDHGDIGAHDIIATYFATNGLSDLDPEVIDDEIEEIN